MKTRLDNILRAAVEFKASDIHITTGVPPIMRIHGKLKRYGKDVLSPEDTEAMAMVVIHDQLENFLHDKGEVDLSYDVPGAARYRVNVYQQRNSIAIAFRVVPTKIPALEDLNMPPVLKKMVEKPQGLILVTGPTGSGKTTTLASMIDYMNKTMSKHIITLEDPIEYLHGHGNCIIDQREIGHDTKSFAAGLRAALRQDPDVILVGELRDRETISTAITAAETGHLVYATLHTSSAASTIDRIIDLFPSSQQSQIRTQLASVLVSVISQRLFPTANGSGRIAATEIMLNNAAVANLIRNQKIEQIMNVIQTSRAQGMHTLESSIQSLLQRGVITMETVQPYLQEKVFDDGKI